MKGLWLKGKNFDVYPKNLYQRFSVGLCDSTVGNFDVSPYEGWLVFAV